MEIGSPFLWSITDCYHVKTFFKKISAFFKNGMRIAFIYGMNATQTINKNEGEKIMFENAEIISSYTGQDAVNDGTLVDVTETAREAGFKWVTRITRTVFNLCTPPKSNKIESFDGRLWDVLYMARLAIRRSGQSDGLIEYVVRIGRKNERLWITIDGTDGYPAIHIMKPQDY